MSMNAEERVAYAHALEAAERYKLRWLSTLHGGVHSGQRAINRLKRKDDLNKAYVLAAETLFNEVNERLTLFGSTENPKVKLALTSFTEARKNLGLVKSEHTAEQCGGRCKYHSGK